MISCVIIAMLVSCTGVSHPSTPQEALSILIRSIPNRIPLLTSERPRGPTFLVVNSTLPMPPHPEWLGLPLNCCSLYINGVPIIGELPVWADPRIQSSPWTGRNSSHTNKKP